MKPSDLPAFLETVLPPERRYLGLIIFISLVAHVAMFFVIKVPILPGLRQAKAPLSVVLWTSEASRGTLGFAEESLMSVRDPRLSILPPETIDRMFARRLPTLQVPEEEQPGEAPVTEWLPSHLASYAERVPVVGGSWQPGPMAVDVESPPPLSGTTFTVDGPLGNRPVLRRPVLGRPQVDSPLGVTVIGVQVNPEGLVEALWVETSSGDFQVDRAGLGAVRAMSFRQADGKERQAGRVTIYWDYTEKLGFDEGGTTP